MANRVIRQVGNLHAIVNCVLQCSCQELRKYFKLAIFVAQEMNNPGSHVPNIRTL